MIAAGALIAAAVPAALLTRSVTGRWWAAPIAAAACVAVPWLRLDSLEWQETVAYAAFLGALLAIYRAVSAPGLLNDAVALGAIAVAAVAHGQLLVLLVAFPVAIVLHERSPVLSGRRLVVGIYAALLLAAGLLAAGALGGGVYWELVRSALPPGVGQAAVEHTAALARAVVFAPFLLGVGWALGAIGRPADRRRHAFAAVSLAVAPLLVLSAAALDVHYAGGDVRPRYLVYATGVLLVAAVCAVAPPRLPRWGLGTAVLAWLGIGYVVSRVTARVNDWFVMTDELLYERLAISIARGDSPLPRVRGEEIDSFNQLYPLLISRVYENGLVPESLHDAHVLNAFVMTSALVPAYLLARAVTGRSLLALGVGVLSVAVPWLTLSSFLLTEVVAYPAFLWAVYAVYRTTASPRAANDALALGAVALASLARVQFIVLLAVLPLAVLAHEGRPAVARHRLLAGAYALLAVAAAVLAATGGVSRVLGTYAQTAEDAFPPGLPEAFLEHLAELALALAILPFLVAVAWLLTAVRGGDPRGRAYAWVGLLTLAALTLQVASFDERFGEQIVRDRYLFYVVPLVLVAFACALLSPAWPRWSLVAPAVLVAAGFALYELPRFEKLNVDTPASIVHDHVVELGGSTGGAQAGLVLLTLVLVLLFVQARARLPRAAVASAVAALVVVALPAQTGAAFSRLFAVPGTSGRPLTHDQAPVFTWVDRLLGPDAEVTMVPYAHVHGDYWAAVSFWWDLEFWNKSVVRAAHLGEDFVGVPSTFPRVELSWDELGHVAESPTPYVAQLERETRFRVAGEVVWKERETDLIEAGPAWRLAWASEGLYEDGWTRPDTDARIRVFPTPRQAGPMTRFLTLRLQPPGGEERAARVSSSGSAQSVVIRDETVPVSVPVCVRPGRAGEVRLTVLGEAPIVGNPVNIQAYEQPRVGGLWVREIAVAGETEPGC